MTKHRFPSKHDTKNKEFAGSPLPGNARAYCYLDVPFDAKETVKGLGARWDAHVRKWYVPHGEDVLKFQRWWPETLAEQARQLPRDVLKASTR